MQWLQLLVANVSGWSGGDPKIIVYHCEKRLWQTEENVTTWVAYGTVLHTAIKIPCCMK